MKEERRITILIFESMLSIICYKYSMLRKRVIIRLSDIGKARGYEGWIPWIIARKKTVSSLEITHVLDTHFLIDS